MKPALLAKHWLGGWLDLMHLLPEMVVAMSLSKVRILHCLFCSRKLANCSTVTKHVWQMACLEQEYDNQLVWQLACESGDASSPRNNVALNRPGVPQDAKRGLTDGRMARMCFGRLPFQWVSQAQPACW